MPVNIHHIESIHGWVLHYTEQAEAYLAETPVYDIEKRREMVSDYLMDYIPRALDVKSARLGDSFTYEFIVGIITIVSAIPGGKLMAGALGGKTFRSKAMEEFGIDSDASVLSLIVQAMVDAGVITDKNPTLTAQGLAKAKGFAKTTLKFVWNEGGLKEEVRDELIRELGNELADQLWHEFLHLKPIIGTIISVRRGEKKAIKKLDAIINSTRQVALSVHTSVVVPTVLERLGLGLKDIQVSPLRRLTSWRIQ
ncbi:hypothetical protein CVT24_006985 [Panaeolus cyanescens]|uniref:Uncharacterized protein n=1 Tax=Panaeolus cyanescens TaxID=181874 RepID=A0A409W5I0_9AGAR|nr:hypothetical protein CVT24_006985 [Panaeolus cyanescens]